MRRLSDQLSVARLRREATSGDLQCPSRVAMRATSIATIATAVMNESIATPSDAGFVLRIICC